MTASQKPPSAARPGGPHALHVTPDRAEVCARDGLPWPCPAAILGPPPSRSVLRRLALTTTTDEETTR